MKNKTAAREAVSKIWALVYRSSQVTLSPEQEDKLQDAIADLGKAIDEDEWLDRKARFVLECAHMHLAALRALPPRKPDGVETLVQDCEQLGKWLER